MRHYILVLITALFIQNSFALYFTKDNAIYERDDIDAAIKYLNKLNKMGVADFSPYTDDQRMKAVEKILDELYTAYLNFYEYKENDFPRPLIVLNKKRTSANVFYVRRNIRKGSNLIILSRYHIKEESWIYAALSHELAHYFNKDFIKNSSILKAYNHEGHNHIFHQEDIPNNDKLLSELKILERSGRSLYGTHPSIEELKSVEVTALSNEILAINKLYPKLFSKSTSKIKNCRKFASKLTSLMFRIIPFSDENLYKLSKFEKECDLTKNKRWDYLFKEFYPETTLRKISEYPIDYMSTVDPFENLMAQAYYFDFLPVSSILFHLKAQREELKKIAESINWDTLKLFTTESNADLMAFKVLKTIGKERTQLIYLKEEDLSIKNKCIESLSKGLEIIPFDFTRGLDPHETTCFRVYRTIELMSDDESTPLINSQNIKDFLL